MYITKVAPLTRIPRPSSQFLSYFTSHKLEKGSLVKIPLRKKKVEAVVFLQKKVIDLKTEIKKADYSLRPISKIIEKNSVLQKQQIELAKWMTDYYWASFGKILSIFLRNSKNKEIKKINLNKKKYKTEIKILPFGEFPESQIKKAIKKGEVLFLTPEKTKIKFWKEKLKKYKSLNLIIGTRSSIFQPFKALKLIVLSEEGNPNYKAQMEPRYNAKKITEKLAEIWGAKLIILSSFPSVETYYRATSNRLQTTDNKKTSKLSVADHKPLVASQVVDMRQVKPWKPLSDELIISMKENIKKKGKTLLFLNRRGTATTLLCQDCGWIQKCENCDVPLTYYLKRDFEKITPELVCHYCDKEYKAPTICKNCKSWNLNILGIGTEKIEEELTKIFGKQKILRMDSETTKTEKEQKKILKSFLKEESSLLLTTSIIFKYFPIKKIPLVAVVSIDSLISQPDFKLEEECARIIDLLYYVSGKKIIIQSFFPESKAVSWIKKNKESFYKKTMQERKNNNYPPFWSLIKISITHKNKKRIKNEAFFLKQKIKDRILKHNLKNFKIIGPAPALIEKTRGEYHWKLILKLKDVNLKSRNNLLSIIPKNWKVDVDPERII